MSHITRRPSEIAASISVYADGVEIKSQSPHPQQGGGKRKAVSRYSRNSQRRHRRALAKIRSIVNALFVTVTYPDSFPQNPSVWKQHHEALFKRLQRWFGKHIGENWRLEMTRRRSGIRRGYLAPHFHSLILNLYRDSQLDGHKPNFETQHFQDFLSKPDYVYKAQIYEEKYEQRTGRSLTLNWKANWLDAFMIWLSWAWYEIVGSGDEGHLFAGTHVKLIQSNKEATFIISRYLTKTRPDNCNIALLLLVVSPCGRPPFIASMLVYITKPLGLSSPVTGRFWGERGRIDKTPSVEVRLTHEQYIKLCRLVRNYLKRKSDSASRYAEWLKRSNRKSGSTSFHILGLGDSSKDEWNGIEQSTIFRMLKEIGANMSGVNIPNFYSRNTPKP